MNSFEHFLHKHTLSFIQEGYQIFICAGCKKPISGPFYSCPHCIFYLHYECARLQRQIQHFFHPCPLFLILDSDTCNACFMEVSGFSYCCFTCYFTMHVECALKPTISSESDEGLIQHFTHWHPLSLIDLNIFHDKPCCAICEKPCSTNSTYGCSSYCSGLTYSCGKCRFKLDIRCGLLPTVETRGADMIQNIMHPHPLARLGNKNVDNTRFGVGHRCRACGENDLDHGFSCSISCDFFIHTSCAELPKDIHHPFHLQHPLSLTYLPLQLHGADCSSCNKPLDGFLLAYRCDGCNFNLHKDCAEFKPSFKHGNYLHALTLCDKRPSLFHCTVCHKRVNKIFLRCFHRKQLTHKWHIDCLSLTQSPLEFELNRLEDADNSDDEFYCDVCEEKREKKDSVYYCAECKFIAEVGCVISELVPSYNTPEEHNAVTSRAISKDEDYSAKEIRLAELNNEIIELSAKSKPLIQEREPLNIEIMLLNEKHLQLQGRLQEIETELLQIIRITDNLEVKRFLCKHQPKHRITEDMFSTEASTSGGLSLSAEQARHMEDESKLLPASNISRNKETAIEVAKLKAEEMVFKLETEKHRSELEKGEEKLERINLRLKELEVDGFLNNDMVGRNMKKNKYATEASTSQEPTADLP
ncbi:hypothetical protein ERO13_D08G186266v2 [Gossypium hirsutum]|nr:hypothetical protein ERO13_D08G186266v2 [Gossypium hirsutum]